MSDIQTKISNIKNSVVHTKVAVVIPARNEEKFIGKTLSNLLNQELAPYRIIVVDDGSTDQTLEVTKKFRNIEIVNRKDTGEKKMITKHIAETINLGLKQLKNGQSCEFVLKLDADHLLPKNYLSTIIKRMKADKKLVVSSGIIKGERYYDSPLDSGRVLRYDFLLKLGLMYPVNNRHGAYILLKANMMGYDVRIYPDLITETLRKTGSLYQNDPEWFFNLGQGFKAQGYIFPVFLLRCIHVIKKNPNAVFSFLKGYLSSNNELYEQELRDYVRKTQYKKIFNFIFFKGVKK